MPDIIKSRDQLNRKNKDLNDGTYAEVVSVENFGVALSDVPTQATAGMVVRPVGQMVDAAGFGRSGSSILDEFFAPAPITSGGVTFNQASGALNIVAGTTANGEFLARSVKAYRGSMRLRHTIVASQRIANNNLAVMLADLIGENVIYTINSSTSVTIFVGNGEFFAFDQTSIGQSVNVGGILGDQGVPGRYPIVAVQDGVSITLAVSGWPSSGGGVCTVFGLNYIRNLFTGTTATNVNVDAQRRGWATNDTVATINTTASPGTLLQCELTGREVFWSDTLRASAVSALATSRASRFENIPDTSIPLHVFVWNFNGPTAPASSTTWTLGSLSVENFANQSVYIQGNRSVGSANALPVNIAGGTVTTVSTVTAANLALPGIIADVASAALTATTTTAAITPTFGISYQVNIPVTAVTGTNPTLDVTIQESDDSGTNWYTVYDFPRITVSGIYRSPVLPLVGNRVRYVQNVSGTTPSFTRSINRLQSSWSAAVHRQLIDRTISLTTLNSTTPILLARDAGNATQLIVNVGAITTTAPALQLEGSDDFGLTWYAIGTPLTAVASSTVQVTVPDINAAAVRARVSTAGVGVTPGYVMIKAHD